MSQNTHTHRHVLLFPIFAVMVLLTGVAALGFGGGEMLHGSVLRSITPSQVSNRADLGVTLKLSEHAEAYWDNDWLKLSKGSVLLRSDALMQVQVGNAHLRAVAGALQVVQQSQRATVVALTTPVLASVNGQSLVVPAGHQWQIRSLSAEVDSLESWREERSTQPIAAVSFRRQYEILKELPRISPTAHDGTLPIVELSVIDHHHDRWVPLIETLGRDPYLHTLFSLHPRYAESIWLIAGPVLDPPLQWVQLLSFPENDNQEAAISSRVFERWSDALKSVLENQSESFKAGVKSWFSTVAVAYERNGYPLRAKSLHQALEKLFSHYEPVTETASVTESVSKPAPVPDVATDPIDEVVLVAQAKQDLSGIGAMFTIETKTEAVGNVVRLRDLVFVQGDSYQLLTLEYNPVLSRIGAIEFDGRRYPNTMSLERFKQWVESM